VASAEAAIRPPMKFSNDFLLSSLNLVTPPTAPINSPFPTAVDATSASLGDVEMRSVSRPLNLAVRGFRLWLAAQAKTSDWFYR